MAADQRMVIRCFRNNLAAFVHDVSHVTPPIRRSLSRLSCCRQYGEQDVGKVAGETDADASPDSYDDGRLFRIKFHAPSLVAVERWH